MENIENFKYRRGVFVFPEINAYAVFEFKKINIHAQRVYSATWYLNKKDIDDKNLDLQEIKEHLRSYSVLAPYKATGDPYGMIDEVRFSFHTDEIKHVSSINPILQEERRRHNVGFDECNYMKLHPDYRDYNL